MVYPANNDVNAIVLRQAVNAKDDDADKKAPRANPAPKPTNNTVNNLLAILKTCRCPNLTENVRTLEVKSPSTSGTSFISAMTMPKIQKKKLDR